MSLQCYNLVKIIYNSLMREYESTYLITKF